MSEVVLQIVWVAAHHGLRTAWVMLEEIFPGGIPPELQLEQVARWHEVHRITSALGNPPAPGGPR